MARITKKQIKEDKFISTTAKLSIFLEKNWKKIVGAIVAVAVAIALILLLNNYIESRNEKAEQYFDEAKTLYDEASAAMATEGKVESVTEKYEEARTKFQKVSNGGGHKDTKSKALFYSGKCSYELGRYDEAISAFQKFVSKYSGSILTPHVQRAIGQCYEQMGGDENLRKAIKQYDKVLKSTKTRTAMEASIDKGRCYEELGELDQAINSYKYITDRFKENTELAIQSRSRELIKAARDVVSKYETALGSGQATADFTKYIDEARAFEGKKQWFEALKSYDKAIAAQKKIWAEKSVGEYNRAVQNATKALAEYESQAGNMINNIITGRELEKDGNLDTALRYYNRAVIFDFLPDRELFDSAQFRISWINSMKKQA